MTKTFIKKWDGIDIAWINANLLSVPIPMKEVSDQAQCYLELLGICESYRTLTLLDNFHSHLSR